MNEGALDRDTSCRLTHAGRRFGDVTPSPEADEELGWFFNEAASAVEAPSGQGILLTGSHPGDPAHLEARAEALRAARKIWGRLKSVGAREALVLEALYTERCWPAPLTRKYGPAVGVAQALGGIGRAEALRVCGQALAAYERARGEGPSVVPPGDR